MRQTWQVSGDMPARRDLLEKMLEDAVTPAYRMVDGESLSGLSFFQFCSNYLPK